MGFMPAFQGSNDGLCGLYAISNALLACGFEDHEAVLRAAVHGLSRSRWPDVLFDGTTYADMQKMTKSCRERLDIDRVDIRYPFKFDMPTTNQEYWDRFDNIFEDDDVRCAIMGVEEPSMHWIVASWDGGRVQFLDSTANRQFQRKNKSSLYAGERCERSGQWRLNPRELIVFSVK